MITGGFYMKCTSAEAAKILRQLNADHAALLEKENRSSVFLAAVGEDIESVRPEYDYKYMQQKLAENEEKIRAVKHALNVFNTTHTIPEFGMTIDQMLVYIPQLSQRRDKLYSMKSALPKTRETSAYGRNGNIIDYRYANYDIAAAEAEYAEVSELLAKAQTALDVANNTEILEINI